MRQAKEAFEISLEQHALDNAVAPPAAAKQKIWSQLNLVATAAPEVNMEWAGEKVQPLAPVRSINFAKLLAAASVILLVGSTVLNFYFYNKYQTSIAKLDEFIASNQTLVSNSNVMQAKLQQYQNSFEMMKDPSMSVVAMKGQAVAPQSLTTVYWNRQTKDVYLLVNTLPQPAADKQYQLWAIVDGVPVDAGLLNMNETNGLVRMKNIPKAQAFAITLEKKGGSVSPDLTALYVMGKI
ncbi:MAG: anti-sigma factor [Chitinophagaceae bacterium]